MRNQKEEMKIKADSRICVEELDRKTFRKIRGKVLSLVDLEKSCNAEELLLVKKMANLKDIKIKMCRGYVFSKKDGIEIATMFISKNFSEFHPLVFRHRVLISNRQNTKQVLTNGFNFEDIIIDEINELVVLSDGTVLATC